MKSRFGFSTKTWLLSAVTGAALSPTIVLLAQSSDNSESNQDPQATLKSAVQRELATLYQQQGVAQQELAALPPADDPTQRRSAAYGQAASRRSPIATKTIQPARKRTLMQRMFPNRTAKEVTAQQSVRPTVTPTRPAYRSPANSVTQAAASAENTRSAVQQTAGSVQEQQYAQQTAAKTDIQRELEKLYARDGRPMPAMDVQKFALPDNAAQPSGARAQQNGAIQADVRQPTKKPTLLERLLPFRRKSKSEDVQPDVAKRPAIAPVAPRSTTETAPRREIPRMLPAQVRDSSSITPQAPATLQPTLQPEPVVSTPSAPVDAADDFKSDDSEAATVRVIDKFANPFTEVSEAEADQQANPFSGLTLEEAEMEIDDLDPAAPSILPLPDQPKLATTADEEPTPQKENPFDFSDNPFESTADKTAAPAKIVDKADDADAAKPEAPADTEIDKEKQSKLELIAQRSDKTGLKGFCIVTLRNKRDLVDAQPEFTSTYESKTYHFSSAEAKETFDANPERFALVAGGKDVVLRSTGDDEAEGSLDFAAWYKNRLYLFNNQETMEMFTLSPTEYIGEFQPKLSAAENSK